MATTRHDTNSQKATAKATHRRQVTHGEASGVEADILLPSQFYALRGSRNFSGEQRLMLAILADAINIFQGCYSAQQATKSRLFREAEEWLFSSANDNWPFSFVNVCEALGIEPQALRKRLRIMEEELRSGLRGTDSFRLRLKESNRAQHMTVNRERAHRRRYSSYTG